MASETIGSLMLVNRPCSKKLIVISDVMIGPWGARLDTGPQIGFKGQLYWVRYNFIAFDIFMILVAVH